jgi:hypothetical protein
VGQPELRELLAGPDLRQLRQRISVNCHLGPLNVEECSAYVQHRLERAGNREAMNISPEAFAVIHQKTKGIPRLMNILGEYLLIDAFAAGTRNVDEDMVTAICDEMNFEQTYWPDAGLAVNVASQVEDGIASDDAEVQPPPSNRAVLLLKTLLDMQKRLKRIERAAPATDFERLEGLAERLEASGEDAVLVYVHGVNNSFADAARRAAQVSYDLGFEGVPAFYSWPTRRNRWIPSYFSDADFSSAPPADLARFLRELGEEAGTIHLIAHSHGSKLLMQAAGQLRAEGLPLGEVILAAPDVDADDLERDTRTILAPLSERVTIYSNQTDLAIGVSAILRWAGLRGRGRSAEDVDQVDATNVVPIFSHGYFAEEPEVLADIRAVIWHDGLSPAQRCYLAEIPRDEDDADQPPAWRFDTDACDVAAFETASAIAAEVRDDPAFCGPFPELFALVDPRRVYAAGEIGREARARPDPEVIFFVDDGAGGYSALAEDAAFLAARSFYADVFGGDPERAPCSATAELSADRPARG